ncbi:hypothetical protein IMX26_03965 [Clostridium sp. 'deep sea']|uniref:hypothetical protein n=1 Tax=Clostridium sp. 'deep sea' TaxID=2779445 RepID=UPI0018968599|nr:hypothetical protein [Clostridium sp. 'deep sea']QOR35983.1 hypothetical protein IMX26_03965 [Clostridium sp. 'deep sea']
MMIENLKNFLLTYGLLMLVCFLSFCFALPIAAELKYKHRNKALTRLAQILITLVFTFFLTIAVLAITALIS